MPPSRGVPRLAWVCVLCVLAKEYLSLFWYSAHPNKEGISSPKRQRGKKRLRKKISFLILTMDSSETKYTPPSSVLIGPHRLTSGSCGKEISWT